MNIIKLISEASIIVQMILLILVFFSVFSWAIIIFKRKSLRSGAAHSRKFLNAFHKSKNLAEVGEAARKYRLSPLAALFQSGLQGARLPHEVESEPRPDRREDRDPEPRPPESLQPGDRQDGDA